MNQKTDAILPTRSFAPGQALDPRAKRLLDSLPAENRLGITRHDFPHVVNRLAADWHLPHRMLGVFDELLVDDRGSRNGFPFPVALELMQLREYYVARLHPELRRESTARDPEVWR